MSLLALLLAARDTLRSALVLTPAECEVTVGLKPPTGCGQSYLAVHPGGGWSNSANEALDERLGFRVTATLRIADAPYDRSGPSRLAAARQGLLARCGQVVAALHSSYDLLNAANAMIGASFNGFVEPPRFRDAGTGEPREVGPDWFGGQPAADRTAGLALTLTFRDARRVQAIPDLAGLLVGHLLREDGGDLLREGGGLILREVGG
ncbi:MAG TPA: hypothetical protein VGF55_10900 [Gemmataceae bacterium]